MSTSRNGSCRTSSQSEDFESLKKRSHSPTVGSKHIIVIGGFGVSVEWVSVPCKLLLAGGVRTVDHFSTSPDFIHAGGPEFLDVIAPRK